MHSGCNECPWEPRWNWPLGEWWVCVVTIGMKLHFVRGGWLKPTWKPELLPRYMFGVSPLPSNSGHHKNILFNSGSPNYSLATGIQVNWEHSYTFNCFFLQRIERLQRFFPRKRQPHCWIPYEQSEKSPWLFGGFVGDYTTQLYRDYNKPVIRIPIEQPGFRESKAGFFGGSYSFKWSLWRCNSRITFFLLTSGPMACIDV